MTVKSSVMKIKHKLKYPVISFYYKNKLSKEITPLVAEIIPIDSGQMITLKIEEPIKNLTFNLLQLKDGDELIGIVNFKVRSFTISSDQTWTLYWEQTIKP